jgi:hypothetical protein
MGDSEIEQYKRMAERCEQKAEALPDIEIKRQFQRARAPVARTSQTLGVGS